MTEDNVVELKVNLFKSVLLSRYYVRSLLIDHDVTTSFNSYQYHHTFEYRNVKRYKSC